MQDRYFGGLSTWEDRCALCDKNVSEASKFMKMWKSSHIYARLTNCGHLYELSVHCA